MPGLSQYQEPRESTLYSRAFFANVTFLSPSAVWLDRVMLSLYLLPGVLSKRDPWSQELWLTLQSKCFLGGWLQVALACSTLTKE